MRDFHKFKGLDLGENLTLTSGKQLLLSVGIAKSYIRSLAVRPIVD